MTTSVITGDIKRSRTQKASAWLRPLRAVLRTFGREYLQWEIYRGDSFQLEVKSPGEALRAAFLIKASIKQIKKVDVRIAIGIGDKTHKAKKISQSNGSAFVNSGECFEHLGKHTLRIRTPWLEVDTEMNLLLELALLTMDHWTVKSAEIVKICIEHPKLTQQKLAKKLKIYQSNVSGRLNRAGYQEIMQVDHRFRSLILKRL